MRVELALKLLKSALVLAAVAAVLACAWRAPQPEHFVDEPLPAIHVSRVASSPGRLSFALRPLAGSAVFVTVSGHDLYCGRPRPRVSCSVPRGLEQRPFRVTVTQ